MSTFIYTGTRKPELVRAAQWTGSIESGNAICAIIKSNYLGQNSPPNAYPPASMTISWVDNAGTLDITSNGNPYMSIPMGSWYVSDGVVYDDNQAKFYFNLEPTMIYVNDRTDQDVS